MDIKLTPPPRSWYFKKRLWLPVLGFLVLLLAWRSSAFWDALSPLTHKTQLYQLAGIYKIDPLLLAAIIRSESHFYPFAESKAGAVGLMQLMPATAEEIALELKLDYQDSKDLYREEINLKLGTHYFAKQLRLFKGNLVLALAAYNAGRANVLSWRLDTYGSDQQALIAAIPVLQTRAYVRRVFETYRAFKRIQSFKRWLGGAA